jgi:hypothetical protein
LGGFRLEGWGYLGTPWGIKEFGVFSLSNPSVVPSRTGPCGLLGPLLSTRENLASLCTFWDPNASLCGAWRPWRAIWSRRLVADCGTPAGAQCDHKRAVYGVGKLEQVCPTSLRHDRPRPGATRFPPFRSRSGRSCGFVVRQEPTREASTSNERILERDHERHASARRVHPDRPSASLLRRPRSRVLRPDWPQAHEG